MLAQLQVDAHVKQTGIPKKTVRLMTENVLTPAKPTLVMAHRSLTVMSAQRTATGIKTANVFAWTGGPALSAITGQDSVIQSVPGNVTGLITLIVSAAMTTMYSFQDQNVSAPMHLQAKVANSTKAHAIRSALAVLAKPQLIV